MLRLPPFDYRTPTTLADAAAILGQACDPAAPFRGQTVRLVAGGTDLYPNLKRRHEQATTVVSLMRIPNLAGVRGDDARDVGIGATTLLSDLTAEARIQARFPSLARAIASISSPPLRNMSTLGGNLCVDTRCTYYNQTEEWRRSIHYCLKEKGETCWVAPSSARCLAHTATDAAPMLTALDARVQLVSQAGERTIALSDLYQDDGAAHLAKRGDEILATIWIPAASDASRCRSSFWKLRRRGSIDFAVLSVAAAVWLDAAGRVERARLVLGAVASRPREVNVDLALLGKPLTPESIAEAAKLARKAATPFDNTDFQAQWRGQMVEKYTEGALREIAGLPQERMTPLGG
jgi:4-hydroxybenzoyl-CoA reductase subunit beta